MTFQKAFTQAIVCEISILSEVDFNVDTIYFGGGTPSVLEERRFEKIIAAVYNSFNILHGTEKTLEVNPGTVTPNTLRRYRRLGINRLNIGVQSFQDSNLRFLKRVHTGKDAVSVVERARKAGFDNIGFDLIYGIPGQKKDFWRLDLQRAVALKPEHLSCYMLTYESGTPMEINLQKGRFYPLDEGRVSELFEMTVEFLAENGYVQYEISNFARAEPESTGVNRSQHNRKYWTFSPYLGLGPSAHSFVEPVRFWNRRSIKSYISKLNEGRLPLGGKEVLSRKQQMIEMVYLGLRTVEGINLKGFKQKFGIRFEAVHKETIRKLEQEAQVQIRGSHLRLTRKGMRFLDSIAGMLI